ncbi:MAG: glycosyltransferase family 2 protein [Proteobacteria bacterium]|jgi:glycosyltransferase involved in cell wall biosynthesis|nr:glycosyltransferase family 2 protein [Pseudomonadota bacterium]MBU1595066.1 glycosyltransferase family 2 protein [Pseudomonadota bacterium]
MLADLLVAVPVYNHAATLRSVAEGVLAQGCDVLVVDDGSTDGVEQALAGLPVLLVRHEHNLGKGRAILTAAAEASRIGKRYLATIDADGQHDPADINVMAAARALDAVVIGARDFSGPNIPGSSRFGRRFSNFWMRLQTGQQVGDVQCGFRIYPVAMFEAVRPSEPRFAFEVEVLAKAAWAGFELRSVDISVHYPPPDERISHFHKLRDNIAISLLNTRLTARTFMPVPHRRFDVDAQGRVTALHPLRSLEILLRHDNTPATLALSAGLGMLIGSLPLIGLTSTLIILLAGYFRLSRITGLAVNQLCMPPVVPALCIEVGYWLRHGRLLTDISWQTLGYEAHYRLLEWVLGSLITAPVLALCMGGVVYLLSWCVRAGLRRGKGGERGNTA